VLKLKYEARSLYDKKLVINHNQTSQE